MKKLLRIVIAFLVLILLVFFAAGIVRPQVTYQTRVTVPHPLEETWEMFNDIDNLHNWIPEVESVETVRQQPGMVGNQYKMTVENNGQETVLLETVKEFVENEKVVLRFEAGEMTKTDQYSFVYDGSATTIKGDHSCVGQGYIHKCIFAFFGPMFRRIDQRSLDQFGEWIKDLPDPE